MCAINMKTQQTTHRIRNHRKIRSKINGTSARPRLFVFKSNKYTYAGIVDDTKGVTLFSFSDNRKGFTAKQKKEPKTSRAFLVGANLGKQAKEKGVVKVVFDRGGYRYHGRVKAVAEGARKAGLLF